MAVNYHWQSLTRWISGLHFKGGVGDICILESLYLYWAVYRTSWQKTSTLPSVVIQNCFNAFQKLTVYSTYCSRCKSLFVKNCCCKGLVSMHNEPLTLTILTNTWLVWSFIIVLYVRGAKTHHRDVNINCEYLYFVGWICTSQLRSTCRVCYWIDCWIISSYCQISVCDTCTCSAKYNTCK